jgi:hypothetical protein
MRRVEKIFRKLVARKKSFVTLSALSPGNPRRGILILLARAMIAALQNDRKMDALPAESFGRATGRPHVLPGAVRG